MYHHCEHPDRIAVVLGVHDGYVLYYRYDKLPNRYGFEDRYRLTVERFNARYPVRGEGL